MVVFAMKISICGLTGVGKTTAASYVARMLNIPHISFSFKEEAKLRGITLSELQKLAEQNKNIDLEFDDRQKGEIKKHDSFVTSTWLGPWFADADLNVWLYAEDSIRAERVAKRDGVSYEDALKSMMRRDAQNKKRYLEVYNINIMDLNKFHICINSGEFEPKQIAEIIIYIAKMIGDKHEEY